MIPVAPTTKVMQRILARTTLVWIGAEPRVLVRAVVAQAVRLAGIGSVAGIGPGLILSSFGGGEGTQLLAAVRGVAAVLESTARAGGASGRWCLRDDVLGASSRTAPEPGDSADASA